MSAVNAPRSDSILPLTDDMPDVLARFDRDLRCLFISNDAERMMGIASEAFPGRTLRESDFPEDACIVWEGALRHTFETGEPTRLEFSLPLASGEMRCYETYSIPEYRPDNQISAVFTITRDITQRKRIEAEQAAQAAASAESASRLRLALDAARMGTWDWEVATGRLTWAGHLEEVHGMAPGSFDGRFETFVDCIAEYDRERVLGTIARALETGGDFAVEFRVPFPDGSLHWIAGSGRVERDTEGRPIRMIGIGWDITVSKHAEEAERARAQREALLNRISQELRRTTTPQEIQQAAVTALGEALGADRCYFARYDVARNGIGVDADWHRPHLPALRREYRLSNLGTDLNTLYRPDAPLVVEDIRLSPADHFPPSTAAALETIGIRSGVGVPLFEDGQLVAALNVSMAEAPRVWTLDEVELIQSVATQIRSAAEAARAQERERNIARHLQDALRPVSPGKIPGLEIETYYRPALAESEVGGDFFDVFCLEKGAAYALVMADLSGKGLAAAAQIATVRHMLRTLLYQRGATAVGAVTALNDMLAEHDLLLGFATLFVGIYDVAARTLTYANAGQEPGLVRRNATRMVEEWGATGPVLGGFPGAVFEQHVTVLAPGDVFALFTDGLTEAGPTRRELLGISGVTSIFQHSAADCAANPQQITAGMVQGVEAQATPAGLRDDVCLLVASVE